MTESSGASDVQVPSRSFPCAASFLLAGLLDRAGTAADLPLVEVARTRVSVHYATHDAEAPVLCVATPTAVRLPNAVLSRLLPAPGQAVVSGGRLHAGGSTWRVTRWWRPPRPSGLTPPDAHRLHDWVQEVRTAGGPDLAPTYGALQPARLVGAGPGLTPSGDDVLAGALVAAHATSDPRLPRWRAATLDALRTQTTTAVSRGLLLHAADGWATPELAAFVTAVCRGSMSTETERLLAVGHTSGAALAAGALHVLGTRPAVLRGAA